MVITIPLELKHEYPFASHFLSINEEKLHYIDEGEGEAILMLHGNPTWSFFYRNLIKHFSKNYRVIVPDHMGCGLSGRPQDYNYSLHNHISNIEALVKKLGLSKITLVVHDWGGAIGLGVATNNPMLVKKIVAMNTAAFRSNDIPFRINILRNPIGQWAVRTFNAFAWPATFMTTEKKLSPLIKKGLLLPYDDYKNRIATAKFVKDIPLEEKHQSYETLKQIEEKLTNIHCPLLLLWGEKDFCFNMNFFKRWREFFPRARAISFSSAGHYLIEDELENVIMEMEKFLKE